VPMVCIACVSALAVILLMGGIPALFLPSWRRAFAYHMKRLWECIIHRNRNPCEFIYAERLSLILGLWLLQESKGKKGTLSQLEKQVGRWIIMHKKIFWLINLSFVVFLEIIIVYIILTFGIPSLIGNYL